MLRLSRTCDYAMRALIELGRNRRRAWMPAVAVAQRAGVPLPFLHKIVGRLVRAGLVETRAGPRGGLRLRQEPRSISLLSVFEAIEGPLALSDCLDGAGACARSRRCTGRQALAGVQRSLQRDLNRITLARLLTATHEPPR